MSERPQRSSKPSGDRDEELEAVLDSARNALRRGNGWAIEQSHHDRLRRDLETIGHACNQRSLTVALRTALAEIQAVRRRADPSYSGLEDGQTLYDVCWVSDYFKRTMYLKFAMNEGILELLSLHEHREKGSHEVH